MRELCKEGSGKIAEIHNTAGTREVFASEKVVHGVDFVRSFCTANLGNQHGFCSVNDVLHVIASPVSYGQTFPSSERIQVFARGSWRRDALKNQPMANAVNQGRKVQICQASSFKW